MVQQHYHGVIAIAVVLSGACTTSMAQCTQRTECTTYASSLSPDLCGTVLFLPTLGLVNISIICPVYCNACPSTTTIGDTVTPTMAPSVAPTTFTDAAFDASVRTRERHRRCEVDTSQLEQSGRAGSALFPNLASMASMTLRECISLCADPQTVSPCCAPSAPGLSV